MFWHDIALAFAGYLSEVLGTISGFGSSTFFVPAALLFEKMQFVLALTGLLHSFGNLSKLALFKHQFDKLLFLKMVIPSVVLCGVGALLSKYVPVDFLYRSLGILLMLLPLTIFLKKDQIQKAYPSLSIILTAASGFITGLIGTGGAIRGFD